MGNYLPCLIPREWTIPAKEYITQEEDLEEDTEDESAEDSSMMRSYRTRYPEERAGRWDPPASNRLSTIRDTEGRELPESEHAASQRLV